MKKEEIEQKTVEEHRELLELLTSLVESSIKLWENIKPKEDVSYDEDGFYIRFLNYQCVSIISIRDLVLEGRYVDAYRLIRCIFENYLLYQLMLRGFLYQKTFSVVPKTKTHKEVCEEALTKLEEDHKNGIALTVISAKPTSNYKKIIVTYRGLNDSNDDASDMIPYYYFAFVDYDSERHIVDRIPELYESDFFPDARTKWQKYHQELYDNYLSFGAMKKALILNNIYTEKEFNKVSIHYNFLSSFIHPNKKAMKIVEGNYINSFVKSIDEIYNYDHYVSELALLYVAFLLKYLIEEILAYLPKRFIIDVNYKNNLLVGFEKFSYFWFLKEEPHEYDKHKHLTLKQHAKEQRGIELGEEPTYYKNPLNRIVGLHGSEHELTTGSIFNSPFQRKDSFLKRY